jgi:hypothetical protein
VKDNRDQSPINKRCRDEAALDLLAGLSGSLEALRYSLRDDSDQKQIGRAPRAPTEVASTTDIASSKIHPFLSANDASWAAD